MSIKSNRRVFLTTVGGTALVRCTADILAPSKVHALALDLVEHKERSFRATKSLLLRNNAALTNAAMEVLGNATNGDEAFHRAKIGSYHKGLPHNETGEVDLKAYAVMVGALEGGKPKSYEKIALGGNVKLANPQGGLAFDLEGCDSHQTSMAKPPLLTSAWRAGEMIESYWMASLRDVSFTHYESSSAVASMIDELNKQSDFRGPKQDNQTTPQTVFRGCTPGDVIGPYISQFLLQRFNFGALPVSQRYHTYEPGLDYLTEPASWLAAQNGQGPFLENAQDSQPRYIRNGRDLTAYVHSDCPYQAYLGAAMWMMNNGVPFNPGNPYENSLTQEGFQTFGGPHVLSLLAEVSNRALKAAWYHKWYVHRTLRPEAYGGLIHWTMIGKRNYPVHPDVLNSKAVANIFSRHGTYFLPQAYPEGCPLHPSYGQGHAAIAGACVTVLKAFFATDKVMFYDPVEASEDGLALVPYKGPDVWQMSVTNELHKLAGNIGMARNFAGVHWRSDYDQALSLGETVAVSVLRDQRATFNEKFDGFTLTKFDGTKVTV